MPGTRTAPAIDGTPNRKLLSVSYLSSVEESVRSEAYLVSASATPAEIEAFIDALQDATTASIVRVSVNDVYEGTKSVGNTTADGMQSLDDKMLIRARNVAVNNLRYLAIPAPIQLLFQPDSELPNVGALPFATITTAWQSIAANYNIEAIYFSERSETNQAVLV